MANIYETSLLSFVCYENLKVDLTVYQAQKKCTQMLK